MKFTLQFVLIVAGSLLGTALLSKCGLAFQDKPDETSPLKSDAAPNPYAIRSQVHREALLKSGAVSVESEKAVAAALNWLARHQNLDGSWGCQNFEKQCKDESCKGHPDRIASEYPVAATAFGLLPFLATGQTHESKGPYQTTLYNGLLWLAKTQDQKTGGFSESMYEQALGTMAICEVYGLSREPRLKAPAQAAIAFIEDAQNDTSGGWHYTPNPPTPGDTSVFGWQMMALKSGQAAGLKVNPQTLEKAGRYLASVAKGKSKGLASYQSESAPTPTMTAVALLGHQNLGMKRSDAATKEGTAYLTANSQHAQGNLYFQYYATQVMHNLPGPDWVDWNEKTRKHLIEMQHKEGCAAGSWDSRGKGHVAGPVMVTSLSALNLAVSYRSNPIYAPEPE